MKPPRPVFQQTTVSAIRIMAASTKKEVLLIVRYPFQLFYWFTAPFFQTLLYFTSAKMFGGPNGGSLELEKLTGNYAAYITIGQLMVIFFGHTIWQVGNYLRREQVAGTLETNFFLPVNPITFVISKAFAFNLVFCPYIPLMILLNWLFLGLQISGSISLALLAFAISWIGALGLGPTIQFSYLSLQASQWHN